MIFVDLSKVMLLRCEPASLVVPLMYRHYGTESAVVPAAMFPVSPVRRGAAAVRPSVRSEAAVGVRGHLEKYEPEQRVLVAVTPSSTERQATDHDTAQLPVRVSKQELRYDDGS